MTERRLLNRTLAAIVIASLLLGGSGSIVSPTGLGVGPSRVLAAPVSPVDETQVPHYFGPNPNWANSPYTLPDAQVVITGNGSGAEAVATVGANGAITAITVTKPGHDYSNAKVDIIDSTGTNTSATADATIVKKGAVVEVTLDAPGTGYTAPIVTFSAGAAAATAYGGVENNIAITNGGGYGYQFPTVDFDMPDGPGGVQASGHAEMDGAGTIIAVVVDSPGSGYSTAPKVVIRDGTLFDPIVHDPGTFAEATATATLSIQEIVLNAFGADYKNPPSVTITDAIGTGTGAMATAVLDNGVISAITIKKPGSGYITAGGIKKFTDPLPGLCVPPDCPTSGKYLPVAVAEPKLYNGIEADEYEIGLVQFRTSFSSSLPPTLVRGYAQIETAANAGVSQHYPLANANVDPTLPDTPVLINGQQAYAVTPPQWLGPVIGATKDKPVRIIFRNLLPTGAGGDLFLPTDSTLMGAGMADTPNFDYYSENLVTDEARNPTCTQSPKNGAMCFVDSRATLHLHGGITPWISDGTPHQWITPDGETTVWPQGVSVSSVPDMAAAGCDGTTDGCMTFYYTNQQSARLMFYHDHAWGITRLNVYAGEAAAYLISDDTEKALINSGTIPGAADTIPLVVQDRTFVPQDTQMYNQYDAAGKVTSYGQDPTWNVSRWGGYGSLWFHHVYMPAQNPGDPSGMSGFGRWMYGPWFWPPAANTKFGPIPNPYYGKDPEGPDGLRGTVDDFTSNLAAPCSLDDPLTWQYDTDPFCEPQLIPGTPLISTGMEQFNDTPIVNGVAYPTITLEPKAYRLRFLNAANDRFFNLQWYVGDPTTADPVLGPTEVALNPAEVAAAQTDPTVFPTALKSIVDASGATINLEGPDWIQIGTEGGFLPAPVVVDGQQVTTWIMDPTRFDVGNVDLHSLLLAPAERADVIVDFSQFAGQTLIMYNDSPAAFPARVPSYDYYTGAPDLSPAGAPAILPGYGPNTRTVMQVKIAGTAAPAFNLAKLNNAFSHKADGSGVFESGQHPIIVGQAAYNSAYGTNFVSSGWCNAPTNPSPRCDGLVRISDTTTFGFNTLLAPNDKMVMQLQPKAIHDEMNATWFDEFGRMQATLGVEAQPPVPGAQNVVLYPYVNPPTELIDATNLPRNLVTYDADGRPVSDLKIAPISSPTDGTQIWRITHNGVDTHPVHFHLYDVQVLNRVTWDNIIIPPDATELGWKDTLRVSPLEDTIVALRPIIPEVPWELPNAIRRLSPMMTPGSTQFFNNTDANGNPTAPIVNQLVNFGWEYVFHCHILTHEEMDMMRPVSVALPPITPDGLLFDPATGTLTWNDNSITETSFVVQKSVDGGLTWADLTTIDSPLDQPNIHETRSFLDGTFNPAISSQYRVVAKNTVGYGGEFMALTVQSVSDPVVYDAAVPPTTPVLTAAYQADLNIVLNWSDTTNETGFTLEKSTDGQNFSLLADLPADVTTFTDTPVTLDSVFYYRVTAYNLLGPGTPSNVAMVTTPPTAPTGLTADYVPRLQVLLNWTDNSLYEEGFVIERIEGDIKTVVATVGPGPGVGTIQSYTDATIVFDGAYAYQVYAFNASGPSALSNLVPVNAPPLAPINLLAAFNSGVVLTFYDNSIVETGFNVQRCEVVAGPTCADFAPIATLPPMTGGQGIGIVSYLDTAVTANTTYRYYVEAVNLTGPSDPSNIAPFTTPNFPPAPVTGTTTPQGKKITVTWTSVPVANGYTIQWSTDNFVTIAGSGSAKQDATSFTSPNLTRGTTYYFRIRANTAADGSSLWAYYPAFPLP